MVVFFALLRAPCVVGWIVTFFFCLQESFGRKVQPAPGTMEEAKLKLPRIRRVRRARAAASAFKIGCCWS